MDISPQQVNDIQEIEKQVTAGERIGPTMLSQEPVKDKSVIVNALAAFGIFVLATVGIIVIIVFPFSKKKVPTAPSVVTQQMQVAPNITVTTQYVNPFATTAQYQNPFIASQNPFANSQ